MEQNMVKQQSSDPYLKSIGSIQLDHAQGPKAERLQLQLIQMLIWIMAHPGQKSIQMANNLAIAEGTRRSYLSKLRNWLGTDEAGHHYLPYAHSQRVWISPQVQWDVHEVMQELGQKPAENERQEIANDERNTNDNERFLFQ